VGCKSGDHPQELVIARYPQLPMSFERICPGFREVLLPHGIDELVDQYLELHADPQHLEQHHHMS
jgi:hypothetical protein